MTTATDEEVATLRREPDSIYDFVNSEEAHENGRTLDLDKQWHAVHFTLTNSVEANNSPLSLIIGSFEEIGPDHGYGPAWLIPKAFIARCDEVLSATSDDELAARYDPAAMVAENVYIADALADEGDEGRDYVMQDVGRLRAFIGKAAAAGLSAFALIT